jgi:hypothetical protein
MPDRRAAPKNRLAHVPRLPLLAAALAFVLVAPITSQAVADDDSDGRGHRDHGAASVLTWNALATGALAVDAAFGPPTFGVGIAYVQAAVYNAVTGIEGRYQQYQWDERAPRGASLDAAVAAAAHDVLLARFPVTTARVDSAYVEFLAAIPDGPSKEAGVAFGKAAAARILELRTADGWPPVGPVVIKPPAPGYWRPTPPAGAPYAAPFLGLVRPFMLDSHDQLRPGPPPSLTSAQYAADINEVKDIGSLTSATRTSTQTEIAHLYGDTANNYPVQLQTAFRDHLSRHHADAVEAARYLAAANLAFADGVITAWDSKLEYSRWRPITAIREADTDGNDGTTADPNWTPLIATPPHPDYLSGHTTVSGAVTTMLTAITCTDKIDLTVPNLAGGPSRYYERADQLNTESIGARIWAGIHTRAADEVGNAVGKQVGAVGAERYFHPLKGASCHGHH